jgi:predicted SnoaL-like aldol condensation-catalyzing enzyme
MTLRRTRWGSLPVSPRAPIYYAKLLYSGINKQQLRGKAEITVNNSKAQNNNAIVLEAFEILFNNRDYAAAERFWSPNYIQHSEHIEPGRDGLFNLIKSTPPALKYEPGIIVVEGDFVIIHGRFSGIGMAVIATDIIRMEAGVVLEHWMSIPLPSERLSCIAVPLP